MRDDAGGMLTADLLLRAYASGVFPMAESRDDPEVFWVDSAASCRLTGCRSRAASPAASGAGRSRSASTMPSTPLSPPAPTGPRPGSIR